MRGMGQRIEPRSQRSEGRVYMTGTAYDPTFGWHNGADGGVCEQFSGARAEDKRRAAAGVCTVNDESQRVLSVFDEILKSCSRALGRDTSIIFVHEPLESLCKVLQKRLG